MRRIIVALSLCAALSGSVMIAEIDAQEHKHEEAKTQKDAAPSKSAPAPKESPMPCCEMMQKMGEAKDGMPMKHEMSGEMKAKMEAMKEMKAKMAEKMKAKAGESTQPKAEPKSDATEPAQKNQHQH